jgi:hypothetical protein
VCASTCANSSAAARIQGVCEATLTHSRVVRAPRRVASRSACASIASAPPSTTLSAPLRIATATPLSAHSASIAAGSKPVTASKPPGNCAATSVHGQRALARQLERALRLEHAAALKAASSPTL